MGSWGFSQRLALAGAALAGLALTTSASIADDAPTPAKIDLRRMNDQPIYPDGALARQEHGNTILAITIEASGRVSKVAVDTSSGFEDLDKVATSSIFGLRFVPATDGHKDIASTLKLTVHFQLNALPNPAVRDADIYALHDISEKIVCKSGTQPLGTFIPAKPVCHTKQEWDVLNGQFRDQGLGLPRQTMPTRE